MDTPAKHCVECGKPITAKHSKARHCSEACRHAFTRRRRDRGAELYDFVMQDRYDIVKRLAVAYHTADYALRDGRPSFIDADKALVSIPMAYSKLGDKR